MDSVLILYILKILYPKYYVYFPCYLVVCYNLKNKLLKLENKSVPRKVLKYVLAEHLVDDIENCCLISKASYSVFKLFYGSQQLAQIKANSNPRVVILYSTPLIIENCLYISNCLSYNLANSENCIKIENLNPNLCPQVAIKVIVSFVNNCFDVNISLLERMLYNYFKTPKILYLNDIFEIPLFDVCPNYKYLKSGQSKYYFKCTKILGEKNIAMKKCFCINGETELRLAHHVQDFVPRSLNTVILNEHHQNIDQFLLIHYPFAYEKYVEEFEKCINPFLSSKVKLPNCLQPVYLIKGVEGSRKSFVVSAVAKKYGLHLLKFDCAELASATAAHTETKLRNIFLKCKLCTPCIVLLKNIQELCLDSDGHYDPRLISSFQNEVQNLFRSNNFPMILACSSNKPELNSNLERTFLQIFQIETPTQEDRYEILRWLMLLKNVKDDDVDLEQISRRTHSFSYGDLEFLVNQVLKLSDGEVSQSGFMKVLDAMQNAYSDSIGAPKIPKVYWEDIGGLENIKNEIIKTIEYPIKYRHFLQNTYLKRSGLLLYGPPGTGKTLIAKAVATECGLHFLSVKGPELLNMYVGQSESNVRQVFDRARAAAPCIIFFDELDSLAPNRGFSGDSGGVMDRVVSQLLSEMDGLNDNTSIFVIGATNRPDLIDPALLRPGRFDMLLYVGISPDVTSKVLILKALTRKLNLPDSLLKEVGKLLPENTTGADIQALCSSAWLRAVKKKINEFKNVQNKTTKIVINLCLEDFTESLKTLKPSVSKENLIYYRNIQKHYENK